MKTLLSVLCAMCLHASAYASNVFFSDSIDHVVLFSLKQEVPASAKVIGTFKLGDNGFKTDCQYQRVIEKAKEKAAKAGGNAIKITELKEPDMWSGCYRIKGEILTIPDAEKYLQQEAVSDTYSSDEAVDSSLNYALLYIYRPKNFNGSAIGYDIYLDDSLLCRAVNNSKYEIKVYQTGKHKLWAKTEAKAIVPVNLVPGKKYYVKCTIQTGLWVGQPSMNLIDPMQGEEEYAIVKGRTK